MYFFFFFDKIRLCLYVGRHSSKAEIAFKEKRKTITVFQIGNLKLLLFFDVSSSFVE